MSLRCTGSPSSTASNDSAASTAACDGREHVVARRSGDRRRRSPRSRTGNGREVGEQQAHGPASRARSSEAPSRRRSASAKTPACLARDGEVDRRGRGRPTPRSPAPSRPRRRRGRGRRSRAARPRGRRCAPSRRVLAVRRRSAPGRRRRVAASGLVTLAQARRPVERRRERRRRATRPATPAPTR